MVTEDPEDVLKALNCKGFCTTASQPGECSDTADVRQVPDDPELYGRVLFSRAAYQAQGGTFSNVPGAPLQAMRQRAYLEGRVTGLPPDYVDALAIEVNRMGMVAWCGESMFPIPVTFQVANNTVNDRYGKGRPLHGTVPNSTNLFIMWPGVPGGPECDECDDGEEGVPFWAFDAQFGRLAYDKAGGGLFHVVDQALDLIWARFLAQTVQDATAKLQDPTGKHKTKAPWR